MPHGRLVVPAPLGQDAEVAVDARVVGVPHRQDAVDG